MYFIPYVLLYVFVSYLCCALLANHFDSQVPGNILLRKIGARVFLSFIVTAWGAVCLSIGFVKTWEVLTVLRVLLGAMEVQIAPSFLSFDRT